MSDSAVSAAIRVRNLHKRFTVRHKAPGLAGSLRAMWRPERSEVEAVRGLSFEMAPGERLGFIGPNGAGKSTTIKMLTGILHPTSGEAEVLGHVPWRERRRLAYRIGTVFGQRPQLWYHLPASDTFRLFGHIYEVDPAIVRRRIGLLAEAFEIEHLLDTPVRKLSLGQRMRCEVAASLLHGPELLLLDEPSIGLDVVAKQRIRDTVRRMSEEEGVGVLLTSHDAGDIEALCKRVIVVNHGRIVYQDRVSAMKRRYLTRKVVGVRFLEAVAPDFEVPGAEILKRGKGGFGLKLAFETRETPVDAVLGALSAAGTIVDVTISDPSLEEVIRTIYEEGAAEEGGAEGAAGSAAADGTPEDGRRAVSA
jgi:ABC-2 type transport system ATP-binding protein